MDTSPATYYTMRFYGALILSRVGIAGRDSSNILKTPEVYHAGLCRKKDSISFYAKLCEAFGPRFLNKSSTVFKNINMRDAGETIKSRMQGYDSKPSMLAL